MKNRIVADTLKRGLIAEVNNAHSIIEHSKLRRKDIKELNVALSNAISLAEYIGEEFAEDEEKMDAEELAEDEDGHTSNEKVISEELQNNTEEDTSDDSESNTEEVVSDEENKELSNEEDEGKNKEEKADVEEEKAGNAPEYVEEESDIDIITEVTPDSDAYNINVAESFMGCLPGQKIIKVEIDKWEFDMRDVEFRDAILNILEFCQENSEVKYERVIESDDISLMMKSIFEDSEASIDELKFRKHTQERLIYKFIYKVVEKMGYAGMKITQEIGE